MINAIRVHLHMMQTICHTRDESGKKERPQESHWAARRIDESMALGVGGGPAQRGC